jgi:hypothetical protein
MVSSHARDSQALKEANGAEMEKEKPTVRVSGRFDGGNPKSASHITSAGNSTFIVRPTWENDPGRALGLGFAVMVENTGPGPAPLEVRVDWGTTQHMEYKRVYYLNREGEEDWSELEAAVEGQIASLKVNVGRGVSYLSLSPMYNYSNYLAFVDALRQRPEARLDLVGKSRLGREIWLIRRGRDLFPVSQQRVRFGRELHDRRDGEVPVFRRSRGRRADATVHFLLPSHDEPGRRLRRPRAEYGGG